jgi:hypothetical protein
MIAAFEILGCGEVVGADGDIASINEVRGGMKGQEGVVWLWTCGEELSQQRRQERGRGRGRGSGRGRGREEKKRGGRNRKAIKQRLFQSLFTYYILLYNLFFAKKKLNK